MCIHNNAVKMICLNYVLGVTCMYYHITCFSNISIDVVYLLLHTIHKVIPFVEQSAIAHAVSQKVIFFSSYDTFGYLSASYYISVCLCNHVYAV